MPNIQRPLQHEYESELPLIESFHEAHPIGREGSFVAMTESEKREQAILDPFTWLDDNPNFARSASISYSSSKVMWSLYRDELRKNGLAGLHRTLRDQVPLEMEDQALINPQVLQTVRDQLAVLQERAIQRKLTEDEILQQRRRFRVLAEADVISEYQDYLHDRTEALRPKPTDKDAIHTTKLATAMAGILLAKN